MSKLLAAIALLSSCATSSTSYEWKRAEEVWADTAFTREAVRCAIAGHPDFDDWLAYDAAMMPIWVREQIAFPHFDPQLRGFYLDANARTLQSSPYRHEVFLHAVPWLAYGDANARHDPKYNHLLLELDERSNNCRRTQP